jgi:seryl-tRNA synthetase
MNEILNGNELPLRYAGISPCFRKEAGAHGRDTKEYSEFINLKKVEQFTSANPGFFKRT